MELEKLEKIEKLKEEMIERINHYLTAEFKAFTEKTALLIKEFKLHEISYRYRQSPPKPIIYWVDITLDSDERGERCQ